MYVSDDLSFIYICMYVDGNGHVSGRFATHTSVRYCPLAIAMEDVSCYHHQHTISLSSSYQQDKKKRKPGRPARKRRGGGEDCTCPTPGCGK